MRNTIRLITGAICLLMTMNPVVDSRAEEAKEQPEAADGAAVPEKVLDVTVKDETITLRAEGVTVQEVLDRLQQEVLVTLEIPDEILKQPITLNLREAPLEKVIEAIAGSHALIYERIGDGEYRLVSARLTTQQDYVAPELDRLSRKDRRNVDAKREQAEKLLAEHRTIFGFAGELNYDQAKALIQERNAKVQAIVDQLAGMGEGGARAMHDLYGENEVGTREQVAMIEALGRIVDEEASKVLGALYGKEDRYSLLRDILGALGGRSDAEAEAILAAALAGTPDMRLRGAAVQALGGRPGALDELTAVVNNGTVTLDVRQESVRSIGRIGTTEARGVLMTVASSGGDLSLRKSAIQELGRSFGEAAVPDLQVLLNDTDEAIRQSTIRALGRVGSTAALDLLRTVAASDASAVIRAHAEAALASKVTAATTPN